MTPRDDDRRGKPDHRGTPDKLDPVARRAVSRIDRGGSPARSRDGRPPRSRDDRPARAGDDRPQRSGANDRAERASRSDRPARSSDRPSRSGDDRPSRGGADRLGHGGSDRPSRGRTGLPASGARRGEPQDRKVRKPLPKAAKGWGGVARRGARVVGEDKEHAAERMKEERINEREARFARRSAARPKPGARDDIWELADAPALDDRAARGAPGRDVPPATRRKERSLPAEVVSAVSRAAGRKAPKVADRLGEAVKAYEHDRYRDARQILRPLVDQVPDAAPVRELYGLTLYRLGSWKMAIAELIAFHELSASYDQHPVLMDCYRGLGRHAKVRAVWDELRQAGASTEVLAEGRMVMAGALADQGRLADAIALLEAVGTKVRNPKSHHLRQWYALADVYERAGDTPRARSLFRLVAQKDETFFDAAARAAG